MPGLETVTLTDVEILSIGGPIRGVGSPPGGDFYTTDDLRAMATSAQELEAAGEWRVPTRVGGEPIGRNKLGHSPKQELARSFGEAELQRALEVTDGELPATGWLTNQRVSDDGTKLLADIVDVPKKLGDLIKAKAYRTRSSELGSVTSQVTGKKHDWVVTGLAWLGGKMPAVRTLDDVVALYEADGLTGPEATAVIVYADQPTAEIVWDGEAGFQDLMSDLQRALNPGPGEPTYWVSDISIDRTKAVVNDWAGDQTWVVPITVDDQGDPTPAPSSDWIAADDALVRGSRDLEERRLSLRQRRADIRRVMPDEHKYSDEQKRTFAEATGLEADKVTDEMLAAAGVPSATEPPVDDPARNLEADERYRRLEQETREAKESAQRAERKLADQERDAFVETVLRDGKAAPGTRDEIVAMYEEAPDHTRRFFDAAPVIETWAREYGVDDEEITEEQAQADEKAYEVDAQNRLGVPQVV